MLVQDFLHHTAARLPDKVGLVFDGQRLPYSELEEMSNRLANALCAHGVQRGDRVVISLNNSIEMVVGIFAALKASAVFVVVHPTTKQDKLTYILNNCQAKAWLVEAKKAVQSDPIVENVTSLAVRVFCGSQSWQSVAERKQSLSFDQVQEAYPAQCPPTTNIDLDLACLIYTSGSTGIPKGVMCDHSNIVFVSSAIIQYLENGEEDIVIDVLPLSFDYGLYQLLMVFRFGGTLVLERGFGYPVAILKRIEEERVTGLPGVPTIFAMLLQQDLSKYDLSSLRYLSNTAANLPTEIILRLQEKFQQAKIYSMYGLTETKRTLYLPPEQLKMRPNSVGKAIPGTEVWLEDELGHRLGAGQVGELVVRGRHVMRGYWGSPEASMQRFRPGSIPGERLCYTGDLFRMDEDGYLYFIARQDDIIKSRGEKISPKEIEEVLYRLPGVVEAAVIGIPDPLLGSAIKAFVVSNNSDLTEIAVFAHCRAHLEDYMVPKYIEFCHELPKTTSGKIKKMDL